MRIAALNACMHASAARSGSAHANSARTSPICRVDIRCWPATMLAPPSLDRMICLPWPRAACFSAGLLVQLHRYAVLPGISDRALSCSVTVSTAVRSSSASSVTGRALSPMSRVWTALVAAVMRS